MTTFHCCLSVRGYLRRPDRDLKGIFRDRQGRSLAPHHARAILLQQLAEGNEVIPFGTPCDGFDYAGGGCPGHEEVA